MPVLVDMGRALGVFPTLPAPDHSLLVVALSRACSPATKGGGVKMSGCVCMHLQTRAGQGLSPLTYHIPGQDFKHDQAN